MSRRNLLWFTSVTFISLVCWHAATSAPQDDNYALFRVFVDTLDQVEREYVRELERNELFQGGLIGLVQSLDAESSYLSPEVYDRAQKPHDEQGEAGVGLYLGLEGGFGPHGMRRLTVMGVLPGSPAELAGMLPGDVITEIDQKHVERLTLEESANLLRGPTGSETTVKVFRRLQSDEEPEAADEQTQPGALPEQLQVINDDGSIDIRLKRAPIALPGIVGVRRGEDGQWGFRLADHPGVAYVQLPALTAGIAEQFAKALAQMKPAELRGLILDLRFNPAGSIDEAVRLADMFVSQGRIAGATGPNFPEQHWDAHAEQTLTDLPLVVLVNRFTAGPAEVLAACLQDHGRAKIVGERTMGRGGVSRFIKLRDGKSALKLTVGTYVRKNGDSIYRYRNASSRDGWGVRPDEGLNVGEDIVALVRHFRTRSLPAERNAQPADFVDLAVAKAAEVLSAAPAGAAASL